MSDNKKKMTFLVDAVTKASAIDRATVDYLTPIVFQELRRMIAEGDKRVQIPTFGTFSPGVKKGRVVVSGLDTCLGPNVIPDRRVVRFVPARELMTDVANHRFTDLSPSGSM